jgi:hypothetical protein
MKKTLLTLLGIATFGVSVFSQKIDINKENKKYILSKINNEKIFNRAENKDYEIGHSINQDKKCRISMYDLDKNGKMDVWVYFKFPGNEYQDASVVFVDENEDNRVIVYIASNKYSQSRLETKQTYREYLEKLNPSLKNILLRLLKPIFKNYLM